LQLPAPSHTDGETQVGASVPPDGTKVHVPCTFAHDWQVPAHAASQQTPSAQCAEAQSASAPHPCPFFSLHPPAPSQA